MYVSNLIRQLTELLESHGDLVAVGYSDRGLKSGVTYESDGAEFNDDDGEAVVLLTFADEYGNE